MARAAKNRIDIDPGSNEGLPDRERAEVDMAADVVRRKLRRSFVRSNPTHRRPDITPYRAKARND